VTLPQPLALFPLQSVLFPGGRLALRIFEPRYLDLIGRCIEAGEPFGVVGLIEGKEVREREETGEGFRRERFHTVGTLAHLSRWERPQPGLMQVRARGGQRFRLHASERLTHGLWMGEAELLEEDHAIPVPQDLRQVSELLQGLVHTLEQGGAAEDMPLQPPYAWDDCGWVANRWSELLPLPALERQHLLELDNPMLRLELVADQLERLGIGT
jgi:Lon protease-like protein